MVNYDIFFYKFSVAFNFHFYVLMKKMYFFFFYRYGIPSFLTITSISSYERQRERRRALECLDAPTGVCHRRSGHPQSTETHHNLSTNSEQGGHHARQHLGNSQGVPPRQRHGRGQGHPRVAGHGEREERKPFESSGLGQQAAGNRRTSNVFVVGETSFRVAQFHPEERDRGLRL